MKKISLQYISDSLKISKPTISLVLNGRGDEKRINKNTQEKIIRFAKAHNYKANKFARGLSIGKSEMIGLVVPTISDTFFARIARRIEKKAEIYGYTVVFGSTGEKKEKESRLIQSMLDNQVDGLIIASSQQNQKDISGLKKRKFPFVLIDREYPNIDTNYVGVNNFDFVKIAVDQLVKNNKKRIGIVTLEPGLEPIKQRLLGYMQGMKSNGLPVEEGFIQELNRDTFDEDMGEVIKKMVTPSVKIDGIIFTTHFLALEGIRILKKLNKEIPKEVALISFGQANAFDLVAPPITSIIQPTDEIGDNAVDLLLRDMEAGETNNDKIIINTNLIIRKSCGAM